MKKIVSIFLLICFTLSIYAGGIKGYIKDKSNTPLPYATIFVKEKGTGTSANVDGFYRIALDTGIYTVTFQYLGYQSLTKTIRIGTNFSIINIELEEQAVELATVIVRDGNEDPAYTIMRKAIAKSKYHLNQLDSYKAKVYIKGSGRVTQAPNFLKKQLAKEGIDDKKAYVTESVNQVSYKRPNIFKERVLSIRSSGNDNNTGPNNFIFSSFYSPKIAGGISPLSPKAFAYYRFEYEGTYIDQGAEVNQIRVIPRVKGEQVFSGTINIIEDLWCIHSLDLAFNQLGIIYQIKQMRAPLQKKVWMPISYQFDVKAKLLGFAFIYKYISSISDYDIKLNPDLDGEKLVVIDEKVEAKTIKPSKSMLSGELEKELKGADKKLKSGGEVTRKELKQILKTYEKQEKKKTKTTNVVYNRSIEVDSSAHTLDSAYWATVRPIPLDNYELAGYRHIDSVAIAETGDVDSLKRFKKKKFKPTDLFFGGGYNLGKGQRIELKPLASSFNFNTVEGYHINYNLSYSKRYRKKNIFYLKPDIRYAFARKKVSGKLGLQYDFSKGYKKHTIGIEGGKYVQQLNADEPILQQVNTLTTLLAERNYIRLFEKTYLNLNTKFQLFDNLILSLNFENAQRNQLLNTSNHKIVDRTDLEYTPNIPINIELSDTRFEQHRASTFQTNITYKPFQKYRIRNNIKTEISNTSPSFSILYKKGLDDIFSGETDFDQVEFGAAYIHNFGVKSKLGAKVNYGFFPNTAAMTFLDFKHFIGNQTVFLTTAPNDSYRLLEYYNYSTTGDYLTANAYYQMRRFLATQILELRLLGIKENIFINYLNTDSFKNYAEVGYSIDNIFRLFRLEFVTSWQEWKYRDFGFRIGVATSLSDSL